MSSYEKLIDKVFAAVPSTDAGASLLPAIEVEGLVKTYGDTRALGGVSFSIPPGQICGYLGPNGAGKTTTVRILAGILQPTGGNVRILGHSVANGSIEARRATAYVPETGALYRLLSPREQLSLVADLYDLEPGLAAERMKLLFEVFGINEVADRRIDTLSKGQRQKVVLTSALIHDPQVILLDEPLTGLDVTAARSLKHILQGLVRRGRTVVFSSHILDVVERICDRAIIVHHGEIVADAPTSELVRRNNDETLESIFHALVRSDDIEGLAGAFLESVDTSVQKKSGRRGRRK